MKNIIYLLLIIVFVSSCEEDEIKYSGPALGSFNVESKTFYVQDVAEPVDTIYVEMTTKSNVERILNLEMSNTSTAILNTHYKLKSQNVVIPPNSIFGHIIVEGVFDQLAIDGPKKVTFKLKDSDNVKTAGFRDSVVYTMRQYCPFVINDFVGDWQDADGTAWTCTLPADNAANTLEFSAPGYFGTDNKIKVVFDATDPANFTCEVLNDQKASDVSTWYFSGGNYGATYLKSGGRGMFSACEKVVEFKYKVAIPGIGYVHGAVSKALLTKK